MRIVVNGAAVEAQDSALLALLAQHNLSPESTGVAVAVNLSVVPKSQWAGRLLSDGDTVDIVHAKAGG